MTEANRTLEEVSLEEFYRIGTEVRRRNDDFELTWSEPHDVDEFLFDSNVSAQLITESYAEAEGRLLAYVFKDKPEVGYFGWYECDPVDELASNVIKKGLEWLTNEGCIEVQGPMNGSSWGSFRFNLTSGKPLFVSEPYQPLYYIDQWMREGFSEQVRYETHIIPKGISRPMRKWQVQALVRMHGLRFNKWPRGMGENEEAVRELHEFFSACFKDNELYKPISLKSFEDIVEKFEQIIDFDHSFMVTDSKGKPVSVLVSYRDIYHDLYLSGEIKEESNASKTLYMKTIATAEKWRGKHLSRVLVNFGLVQAYKNGYEEVVFGTMMKNNKSAQYSRSFFKAQPLREYTFLKKNL